MTDMLLKEILPSKQNLKYLYIFSSIYTISIITSLTVSARLFPLQIPFTHTIVLLTGGTWIIPITFFVQDITTEVYGYAKSNQLILLAIPLVIFYICYLKITTFFPLPCVNSIGESYNQVFNSLPRHLIALLAALTISNLTNNYLLAHLKKILKGRYLPLRFIGATAIGEAMLQFVGTTIAWFGNLQFTAEILPFILFSYFYKVAFEAIMTPINVYICAWIKKAEGIDIYDV